jgi:hypothetical protein
MTEYVPMRAVLIRAPFSDPHRFEREVVSEVPVS